MPKDALNIFQNLDLKWERVGEYFFANKDEETLTAKCGVQKTSISYTLMEELQDSSAGKRVLRSAASNLSSPPTILVACDSIEVDYYPLCADDIVEIHVGMLDNWVVINENFVGKPTSVIRVFDPRFLLALLEWGESNEGSDETDEDLNETPEAEDEPIVATEASEDLPAPPGVLRKLWFTSSRKSRLRPLVLTREQRIELAPMSV